MGATEGHARVSNTQTLQAVVYIAYIAKFGALYYAGVSQTINCSSVPSEPYSALGQCYPVQGVVTQHKATDCSSACFVMQC